MYSMYECAFIGISFQCLTSNGGHKGPCCTVLGYLYLRLQIHSENSQISVLQVHLGGEEEEHATRKKGG
jgi:hypothetical protein